MTKMISWQKVDDIDEYVTTTLANEAEDIPSKLIDQRSWYLANVTLTDIKVDREMIERQDIECIHIQRRDCFIYLIETGRPILPLIVLGLDMFLVDGYARYRALLALGATHALVTRQGSLRNTDTCV